MIIAQEFIDNHFSKNKLLALCSIARSSYYYRPSEGKQGRKPYAKAIDENGKVVDNEVVIKYIHALFNHPFVDYGYYKTYIYLRRKKRLNISKHLVYRLMKSHQLLRNQYVNSSKKSKRNWVKDLLPQVEIAFCYLEFDIKFVWVAGQNRNMQVLTVLDVYSRWNISHHIGYSIKYQDVISLFERIFEHMRTPEKMYVRCDNGAHRGGGPLHRRNGSKVFQRQTGRSGIYQTCYTSTEQSY